MDLFVDLAALEQVQQELATLMATLDGLGDGPRADAGAFGSANVAHAVDRFTGSWKSGRDHMTQNLQACRTFAQTAVTQYTQAECSLEGALAPGDGSTSP